MDQYTVHPLTKLSHKKGLRMTQVDQSWGLFDHQLTTSWSPQYSSDLLGTCLLEVLHLVPSQFVTLTWIYSQLEPRGHVHEKEEGIESARKNCLAILWVLLVLICPVCSQKASLIIFTCCFNISFCLNTCEFYFSYFLTIANNTQHVK